MPHREAHSVLEITDEKAAGMCFIPSSEYSKLDLPPVSAQTAIVFGMEKQGGGTPMPLDFVAATSATQSKFNGSRCTFTFPNGSVPMTLAAFNSAQEYRLYLGGEEDSFRECKRVACREKQNFYRSIVRGFGSADVLCPSLMKELVGIAQL